MGPHTHKFSVFTSHFHLLYLLTFSAKATALLQHCITASQHYYTNARMLHFSLLSLRLRALAAVVLSALVQMRATHPNYALGTQGITGLRGRPDRRALLERKVLLALQEGKSLLPPSGPEDDT